MSTGESTWDAVRAQLHREWARAVRRTDEDVLRERARRLAQPPDEGRLVQEEVLRTRIGGAMLCFPTPGVRAVSPLPRWVPLAGTPRHLLGLARVGAALGPLFDVGPLITGRASERGVDARLLTLTGSGPELSIVVEAVVDTAFAPRDPSPAPPDAPGFVAAMTEDGALLIDPDALLADPRLMVDHSDVL